MMASTQLAGKQRPGPARPCPRQAPRHQVRRVAVQAESKGDSLEDRIASGEFGDSGSTKEKLTRPVRKALAQDPTGIGACVVHAL
jgi:hypothetical protein